MPRETAAQFRYKLRAVAEALETWAQTPAGQIWMIAKERRFRRWMKREFPPLEESSSEEDDPDSARKEEANDAIGKERASRAHDKLQETFRAAGDKIRKDAGQKNAGQKHTAESDDEDSDEAIRAQLKRQETCRKIFERKNARSIKKIKSV
ncbi:hypothetical protein CDEST_05811 [Colletotrichum destructivum]|uniref:Uncharacterized protein n=1 Tax=Colletotrichum destructivum TaxID=34406 RepID=A0AAX4IBS3_9PEZI|nr:hypothetical protein CDEST_05811 [Colletotrichum destructivum]